MRWVLPVLALAALAFAPAGAWADNTPLTIPGHPVKVFSGESSALGANVGGSPTNAFFPPTQPLGNAGFFVGLPAAVGDLPAGTVFGSPSAGSGATTVPWTDGVHTAATGSGAKSSPFTQATVYTGNTSSGPVLQVAQIITYVNGDRSFHVTYGVENVSSIPIRFRASTGADLYLEGSDSGTGFLTPGPPRFVGGLSAATGLAGGIKEVTGGQFPSWSRFQESRFSDVFTAIGAPGGAGLSNTVDPTSVDNGVGVQWDNHYTAALAPGSIAFYGVVWSFESPPPVVGKAANVQPVKGTVLVKFPTSSGAAHAAQKGLGFVPLTQARQIPIGSLIDTTHGTVRLTTASTSKGKVLSGDFSSGLFQVLQSSKRSKKGLTELRLKGSSFARCGSRKSAIANASRRSKRRIRRLKGNAHGRFRTRGRYSAATVRGTKWTVTDRCDGTLTSVSRGRVVVSDFRRHKHITVKKGKHYLAKAPG